MPEDRKIAEAREFRDYLAQVVVNQACDAHRLAVAQLDGGAGAALAQGGNEGGRGDAGRAQHQAAGVDQLADADVHLEVDAIVGEHDRQELDGHAELLELDVDPVVAVVDGNRESAARQELRFLAGQGGQRRLGQDLGEPLLLRSVDGEIEEEIVVDERAEQALVVDGQVVRCELVDRRAPRIEMRQRGRTEAILIDEVREARAAIDAAERAVRALDDGVELGLQSLDLGARDLGDLDLEHHLLRPRRSRSG